MRRLLVTGASGELGRWVSRLGAARWQTTGTFFSRADTGGGEALQLDLRDRDATTALITRVRPDVIIHAAASDRSTEMVATNALAAQNVAHAARETDARLIALSTDMIYDGRNPPYREDDPPTPLSDYGRVKADNEQWLLATAGSVLVVRTSLIYDLDPACRQISWMESAIREGRRVTLFIDEVRQPIWARNLAEALLELANGEATGLVNVAGPEPLSRWDYGCRLLRALGYDPARVAEAVRAEEVAPGRPRDLTLALDKARALLRMPLLSLDEVLSDQLDDHPASTTTSR